jgi:hypothetical protein
LLIKVPQNMVQVNTHTQSLKVQSFTFIMAFSGIDRTWSLPFTSRNNIFNGIKLCIVYLMSYWINLHNQIPKHLLKPNTFV